MILLTNGCSWTWGGALELDPLWQDAVSSKNSVTKNISTFADISDDGLDDVRYASVWPYYLGNMLGSTKTINLAAGGGSNQRLVRTTLNWILSQNPEDLKNTVAVIQWSDTSRYEYYTPLDVANKIENIENRWAKVKIDLCINRVEKNIPYKEQLKQSQRRFETYTDIESMYRTITEMTTLAYFFDKFKIKYFFWDIYSAYPISPIPNKMSENIYPEPFKSLILTNFNWVSATKYDYEGLDKYNDSHPSLLGHKQIAELIYNQILEKI
jgi:hypothetical protein